MKYLAVSFFFLFLISCGGSNDTNIPENILPPEKLTDVLVDVHILEAATGLNVIQRTDTAHRDTNFFYSVFENNYITKKQYDESMEFYMKHPALLNQVYDSVLAKLDKVKRDTL